METVLTYIPLDVALIAANFDRFLYGVWVTLNLTFLSLVLGGLLSIPMAIARASGHAVLNPLVQGYTYVFRGTPLLVQTYLIYYGVGQFEVIRQSFLWDPILSSAWWCALIAFTLNTAAYTTELLRGAIADTPKGEVEAAIATGHSYRSRMRRIILPSAFRRAIPAYSNEVIFMLHGSVIASTITLQDILGVGRWLNGRYYLAYEGFITAAVLYFLIVLCITWIFRSIERRYLRHLTRRATTASSDAVALPTAERI
ncbi:MULTISPECIES: ABC transporter permease [Alphaproteobacteria]|jgi:arginine/ornithine transport system permease protein|uniref:ABC transporter permease n=1 Tax=Alphaproteobacteria TaxID=28211 RepID=UPI00156A07C5|nr:MULTISPECIES: ABC transporter permease [Rhodobacterales]MEC7765265.1 ABC transporter permease [Pseudomonadota bacterium]NRP13527.1 Histidine transport system permease protein HisM [Aliiroseovarius sp. xm-d-517]NRP41333.1 Histidine transport system permease protein HisM [Aliiroseovarius sp. xm-m-339-2]NRP62174.1 Histidine transport system permease protein HisM [Aliiroseovarius sp. xm-a-151]